MLLRLLKSEQLQKIHISFDISWTSEAAKIPKEIRIYFSCIFYRKWSIFGDFFSLDFFSILTVSRVPVGWLLQWRGGSRLVAWQNATNKCTLQGMDTNPTLGSSENHRLKMPIFGGYVFFPWRVVHICKLSLVNTSYLFTCWKSKKLDTCVSYAQPKKTFSFKWNSLI